MSSNGYFNVVAFFDVNYFDVKMINFTLFQNFHNPNPNPPWVIPGVITLGHPAGSSRV